MACRLPRVPLLTGKREDGGTVLWGICLCAVVSNFDLRRTSTTSTEMLTTWDAAICTTARFAGLVDTRTNCTAFAALARVKENEKTSSTWDR